MMYKKQLLTGLLGFACISGLWAQPTLVEKVENQPGKVVIPYEKWKLPNGLTILLSEDHSDPVVNVVVTYKVGSNREDIGRSGFAHLFEHMMFQGSKHVADEEHFKMVSTAGGDMNGFTEHNKTVYYESVPSNNLEMALWLEADRMGFLLDSLTSKKFETQRSTVKNEKTQNVENQPYGLAREEEINKILYPPKHPYAWPVIGYTDDLNRVTVQDVKNFFLRWYGPNNAILTVTGDFKPEEALAMIDKYYGTLKPCPEVKKLKVPPVTLASDKYGAYKDKVYLPLNLRVYPTVPQYHRDEPAISLMASMMGSGNNSLFYKKFVKTEIAAAAFSYASSEELSGEFTIQIYAYPPEDFNLEKLFTDLDNKVKETIDEFEKTGITDEALARVKGDLELGFYSTLDQSLNKALTISEWERLLGKPYTISDEIERYSKVTKEDIVRVFNKYIKGAGAAILNTYPTMNNKDTIRSVNPYAGQVFPPSPEYAGLTYAQNPDKFDRSKRPVAGAPKTVKTPEFFQTKLKSGMPVLGTKYTESPIININITMEGGSLVLPPEMLKKMGLAELTCEMLNEGTKNFTTEQISAELNKLGASVGFYATKSEIGINVSCLKKNLDGALKVLEEKLLNPGFDPKDFKRVKKQYIENLKSQKVVPQAIASKAFNSALYGSSVLGLEPTVKTVDNIELQDLKNYYDNYFTSSLSNVVIVGDIDEADIMAKLEFLNKWTNKEVKLQPIPEPIAKNEPQFFIHDKAGAPGTIVIMGFPSLKFDATGDFFKNQIANFALGGSFNSRLNLNLREDKDYTYGIYSGYGGNKYTGRFSSSATIKRPAGLAALFEINKEFKKYYDGGIDDKELEYTKSSMMNSEALNYEGPYQKASFLSQIVRYNLPKDYVAQQNQILRTITRDEVNAQIKKYFDLNKMVTVVVGDKVYFDNLMDKGAKDAKMKEMVNSVKLKKISID